MLFMSVSGEFFISIPRDNSKNYIFISLFYHITSIVHSMRIELTTQVIVHETGLTTIVPRRCSHYASFLSLEIFVYTGVCRVGTYQKKRKPGLQCLHWRTQLPFAVGLKTKNANRFVYSGLFSRRNNLRSSPALKQTRKDKVIGKRSLQIK